MSKKVLVYGAAGGIGEEVARRLAERGAQLHLAGRAEEQLESLAAELGATHSVGDVTDETSFQRIAKDAGEELDGLVYAVGTINLKGFQRLDPQDYINDFRINSLGAALAVQASLKALRNGNGASIVFYSSVAAGKGFPFHASIAMAKSAIEGLTVSLASELAPNIRVNAIAPSLTKTPLAEKLLANEKTAESMARMHPLRRLGTAQDIAAATMFLLSDDSSWMTGQVIGVDGGRSTLNDAI